LGADRSHALISEHHHKHTSTPLVFFWQCLRSEYSHFQNRRFKRFFMHQATLLSPSDNKPILGWFKSILSTCTAASDNASRSGQQIRAAQVTSCHQQPPITTGCTQLATDHRPPQHTGHQLATTAAAKPEKPAKSGQNQRFSKGKTATTNDTMSAD
jgi:hypothetical protein